MSLNKLISESKPKQVWRLYLNIYIGFQVIPFFFAVYNYPFWEVFLATQLVIVCLYPSFRFVVDGMKDVPIFPIICLSYAYQFAVPVFTVEPYITTIYGDVYQSDTDVIAALILSILGVTALEAGYYGIRNRRINGRDVIPAIKLHLDKGKAFAYCVCVGALTLALLRFENSFKEAFTGAGSILWLLQNQILVAIAIMCWMVYSGTGAQLLSRTLLCILIAIQLFQSLAGGILDAQISTLCIVFISKWTYRKRVPLGNMIAAGVLLFFLNPVKGAFRDQTWWSGPMAESTTLDKAALWVDLSYQYWGKFLSGEQTLKDTTTGTLYRTDLIHQFAYIYSLTPSYIPYQAGGTYSFFMVSMIPRVFWPDKPLTTTNKWYAITYGITTEEGAEKSNFGISLLGECYVNFGLVGVIFMMAFQGAVLSTLEQIFSSEKSGAGGHAVFLAFSIWFLNGVGTSAEVLFGAILQNMICSCAILIWLRKRRPPLIY